MLSAIQKIVDNKLRYNLAIAGPIGSGKTTLCNYIWNEINKLNVQLQDDQTMSSVTGYYKEWIDHSDICKQMLINRTNGLISRFTLQSFILDEWQNMLTKEPLRNFNLFERTISECSMCFCEDLTFKEYDVLHTREHDIAVRFGIPCVDEGFSFNVATKERTEEIFEELVKQIEIDVDFMLTQKCKQFNRIFGMKLLDAETLVKRIDKRARPGEEDLRLRQMNEHLATFKRAYSKFETRSVFNINMKQFSEEETLTDEHAEEFGSGC
jgi:deoxyadenosine/deoxycytidine kinase